MYGFSDGQDPRFMQQSSVFFDGKWQAICFPMIAYGDPDFFDTLAIHELWHAYLAITGKAVPYEQHDAWDDEEIIAHELEGHVLNTATKGVFFKKVKAVVDRHGKEADIQKLLGNINPSELLKINSLFEWGGHNETELRYAEYTMCLAQEWVRRHVPATKAKEIMRDAYRFLSQKQ